MIRFESVALLRGNKTLFSDSSLTIHPGQRVGLTGRNGTGKSSLFSLLLKGLEVDAGDVTMPERWVIAHVAQETPSSEKSALDYVLDGDEELRKLQQAIETLNISHRAYHRILKLARTISDLDGAESIQTKHLSEAIRLRSLDKNFSTFH